MTTSNKQALDYHAADRDEAKPREVYVSQSPTKSGMRMLTVERLQMIAIAIVQINALYDGREVPLELAEYWACRILLDEDERES